jgi:hypothetical protein
MTAASFCHGCGSPLSAGANYCRSCGAPRTQDAGAPGRDERLGAGAAPGGAPQPEQAPPATWLATPAGPPHAVPPAGDGRERGASAWVVATVAVVAFLLVAGVVLTLVLATGGKQEIRATAAVVTVTTPPARAGGGSTTSAAAGDRTPQGSSEPAHPLTAGTSAGQAGFVAYRGQKIAARIPAGWKILEDEAQKEGYVESKWQSPTTAADTVLIDTSPATDLTLEQDAAPVHADLEKVDGYEEVSYGAGDLGGVESWMWIFRVSGDERIDYFFNSCGQGFGVLGSSESSHFAQMREIYRAVAQSTRAACP